MSDRPYNSNEIIVQEMVSIINTLIKFKDYENAKEELKIFERKFGKDSYYKVIYMYYKNLIEEQESMTDEIREDLEYGNFYLGQRDNCQKLGDALFYFKNGLRKSNHNLFNYYIGRTYYSLGDYETAFEYFRKYSLKAGSKAFKNYVYMGMLLSKKMEERDYDYAELCVTLAEKISKYDFSSPVSKKVNPELKFYIHERNMADL